MLDRRSNVEQPHPNTCEWILTLTEYQDWRADSRGLIWIKGKPGAGKSTLMAFLFSRLKEERRTEPGIYLEFFYNARGTEMQRKPLGMLRSLLNQLFRQDSDTRTSVREVFKEKLTAFGLDKCNWKYKRNWEWQRPELESILLHAVVMSAQQHPVTIFVDALDEAGEQSAREMATFFHRINDLTVTAEAETKICISCRHYPVPATVPGIEVCVEKYNGNDIATFVEDRLDLKTLVTDDSPDQQAWHDLEVDLLRRATGVFQWAHLVVPMVNKYISEGDSPEDIRNWLQRVPEELGEVYKHILRNVIEPKHHNQSFLLFQWVSLAERPLSVTEMRYALAAKNIVASPHRVRCHDTNEFIKTDDRMKQRVKTLSGGLVEVVPNFYSFTDEETVQVIHQSVNDFLLTHGLALFASLQRNEVAEWQTLTTVPSEEEIVHRCQTTLFRSCLNYLVTENVPLGVESMGIPSKNSPWIRYTTIYALPHAKKAAGCWFRDTRGGTLGIEIEPRVQAAGHGHMPAIDWLLCLAVENDEAAGDSKGALQGAAQSEMSKIVKFLIKEGADINAQQGQLGNVLYKAAGRRGCENVVQLLLNNGADVNAQGGYYGNALQAAAWCAHENVVQILLNKGADVNAQGGIYGTALMAAVKDGRKGVIKLLLDNGSNPSSEALGVARGYGMLDVVQQLKERLPGKTTREAKSRKRKQRSSD